MINLNSTNELIMVNKQEKLLSLIKIFTEKNDVIYSISEYKIPDTSPINGINIGCQIYKHSKNKDDISAIIYLSEIYAPEALYDIMLAIAIEIQGLENVNVISISTRSTKAYNNVISGDTYNSITEKGMIPEKCLKDRQSTIALGINHKMEECEGFFIVALFNYS